MRTRSWLGIVGGAAMALGAAACGLSNDAASAFASGGRNEADGGLVGDSPSLSDAGASSPILQDNAILLVHAASGPAFRLCFGNERTIKPQPDATLLPAANVVGVDVGSAVRLNPIKGTPGRVFLFPEPLIRASYGPGTQEPSCGALTDNAGGLYTEINALDIDLSTGIHVLAVTGCPAQTSTVKYTKAECGDAYTGASTLSIQHIPISATARSSAAAIPAQILDLSRPLEIARAKRPLRILYGDLKGPETALRNIVDDPQMSVLAPPSPTNLPLDVNQPGVFEDYGFKIGYADSAGSSQNAITLVKEESLASIANLSSPRALPTDYYTNATSYVFLLLGAPAPAYYSDGGGVDPDELRNVHMVAVPVALPKPDGGADDGGANDGGNGDASPDGSTGP